MGFSLKKFLNPKNAIKRDLGMLDPLGLTKSGGKGAPPQAAPAAPANPFAQFGYTPGIGYGTGADGSNPFTSVMSQIPAGFFQNPQAMAALNQALGTGGQPGVTPQMRPPGQPTTRPVMVNPNQLNGNPWMQLLPGGSNGTPGPAPSQATTMGQVGGFGNGGGKMGIPGKVARMRAK